MQYYILYSQKYIENVAHPNNSLHISLDNYDYLECVDLLRNNINSIATFCMARNPSFYSAKSGYSFTDIQLELEYLRDTFLYDLEVYILENKLTRDRGLLLQKESNNLRQYQVKIENTTKYIKEQQKIIEQFEDKLLDGKSGVGNIEDIGIINYVEEGNRFRESVDTTYDVLINNYTQLLLEANYYESEMQQTQKIIDIYSNIREEDIEENIDSEISKIAKVKLNDILKDFNELYDSFLLVVKDYYNVRSAEYLSFNSNVKTVQNVNLKLYLIVSVFMFFVLWSCFFIAVDRIKDIIIATRENKVQNIENLSK